MGEWQGLNQRIGQTSADIGHLPLCLISIDCSLGPQAVVIHTPPHTLMLLTACFFCHIVYVSAG